MKEAGKAFCAALLVCLSWSASPASAEDVNPVVQDAEEINESKGLSIYVQGGYIANGSASKPSAGQGSENDLRVFDHKANSFTLDLAQFVLTRDAGLQEVGYRLRLSAGETAKYIHARGLSGAPLSSPQIGEETDAIDLTEVYLSYIAGVGAGLRLDAGKMATYFGAESLEAKNNPNYSHSLLFNYAIPRTHTGLRITYPFSNMLNASVHVVNGWDNAQDNNTGKSLGLSVGYAPVDFLSATFNYMTGPEQDNNNGDRRSLVDIVAVIKPSDRLSFILNYDNGGENNFIPDFNARWSGFSIIGKYDFTETYSLAVRTEAFHDKDGARIVPGVSQKVLEITVTPELRLDSGLIIRPEYRHDSSEQRSFNNGTKKYQDTLAIGLMYTW